MSSLRSSYEVNTHVFVVRIWREPRENQASPPEWRAMIEHVQSGQRIYTDNLDEITNIVKSFLDLPTRQSPDAEPS
jgi:hypothetical protein